jgi:malate dehydrogenase (oxaloacetate-decarboxylating)(NADP+)
LIGTTGKAGAFSHAILQAAAKINKRPIVFALSNPTSVAECTAQEAYEHTDGRAVFASGSPFDPVTVGGKTFAPAQGNNAYIFPGVGLGVIASASRLVSDQMFLAAARALADQVSTTDLDAGRVYPRLNDIRKVSAAIAIPVIATARRQNLATHEIPEDLHSYIRSMMFDPQYASYA